MTIAIVGVVLLMCHMTITIVGVVLLMCHMTIAIVGVVCHMDNCYCGCGMSHGQLLLWVWYSGIFLEKLLRGGKIEIFVSKGGHACVRVHALIVCVPVLILSVCVPA